MQTINITLYSISYIIFFIFNWKCVNNHYQRLINDGEFTSKPYQLIGSQILGAIWLGFLPLTTTKYSILKIFNDIKSIEVNTTLFYILILSLILFIALKQSKYAYKKRPQSFKIPLQLSVPFFISYFLTRAVFLCSYELWFRGGLLFETSANIGMLLSIVSNVFLYVLLHVFNSRKELLASIPFGIVACLFCFLFNAVWPAIILHIVFSLGYEINFYRLNLINIKNTKS